jgi:hypothetical protein
MNYYCKKAWEPGYNMHLLPLGCQSSQCAMCKEEERRRNGECQRGCGRVGDEREECTDSKCMLLWDVNRSYRESLLNLPRPTMSMFFSGEELDKALEEWTQAPRIPSNDDKLSPLAEVAWAAERAYGLLKKIKLESYDVFTIAGLGDALADLERALKNAGMLE